MDINNEILPASKTDIAQNSTRISGLRHTTIGGTNYQVSPGDPDMTTEDLAALEELNNANLAATRGARQMEEANKNVDIVSGFIDAATKWGDKKNQE